MCLVLVLTLSVAVSAGATPDDQTPGQPGGSQAPSSRDFFLGQPRASIDVRGSWIFASAGSDLFDFVTEQLTIDRSQFSMPAFAIDLGIRITPRVDVVFGMEFSSRSTPSEYRKYVDNQRLPIEQTTSLREANITGSVKVALTPRGRSISRFAWIPRAVTPYVGAGGGLLNYEFKQDGDFVDYVDLSVFPKTFVSGGWTPSAHAFGGVDVQMYRRLYLAIDARYVWASATLERDFVDFDPIDLAGFRVGAGLHVIF
jgi:hypothetical protein